MFLAFLVWVQIEKVVYIVFFAGERARLKISKICEAFGVNRYPFPEDAGRQRQMKAEVCRLKPFWTWKNLYINTRKISKTTIFLAASRLSMFHYEEFPFLS